MPQVPTCSRPSTGKNNTMKKILLIFIVVVFQVAQTSCVEQSVQFSPLTENEKQDIGTVGIAAEVSDLEAVHKQKASVVGNGLREVRDRVVDTGEGAWEGVRKGFFWGDIGPCSRYSCLLNASLSVVGMTVGGIAGGVDGIIHRKTYSGPPPVDSPEKSAYQAVQGSIDALGLPEKLRDKVWERIQKYTAYKFDLVSQLPADPLKTLDEYGLRGNGGARYWPLRDRGIRTVLKFRIPFIEFHGSGSDGPYRLVIPVETTLFNTEDRSCIRQMIWEYQGGRYRVAEWNAGGAKLFVEDLDRFFDLVSKRVTPTFFGKETDIFPEERNAVIPKSETPVCVG